MQFMGFTGSRSADHSGPCHSFPALHRLLLFLGATQFPEAPGAPAAPLAPGRAQFLQHLPAGAGEACAGGSHFIVQQPMLEHPGLQCRALLMPSGWGHRRTSVQMHYLERNRELSAWARAAEGHSPMVLGHCGDGCPAMGMGGAIRCSEARLCGC